MQSDIKDYIDRKGWEYRMENDEIVLKVCPICRNENFNFYLNQINGMYHCWICQDKNPIGKGHLTALKEYLGDLISIGTLGSQKEDPNFSELVERCHANLLLFKPSLKYLSNRGIHMEAIKYFKLGYTVIEGQEVISIPSIENGIPKLIKYRKFGEDVAKHLPKYFREKGGKSILFNTDLFNDLTTKEIILTEGELDAITLWCAGFKNVVGNTGGAGTLLPEWYDKMVRMEKVYVCYDQDETTHTGQKAAEKVARRLKQRVRNVVLPPGSNDINDYFVLHNGTYEGFSRLLEEAQKYDVPGIVSIEDSLKYVYEAALKNNDVVVPTPWNSVNKLLKGGIRKKNVLVLGAPPKVGKTHWCLQWGFYASKELGVPVLFFCMEMAFEELSMIVVCMNERLYEYEYHPLDAAKYADNLRDIPFYLGYDPKIKMPQLEETFREAVSRYGLGLIMFDNLTWLTKGEKDRVNATGDVTKGFKNLSMELDIPIVVVAQPRKLSKVGPMNYWDYKDSSAIAADADILCILHRERVKEQAFANEMLFRVDAGRFTKGGQTELFFDGEAHMIRDKEMGLEEGEKVQL